MDRGDILSGAAFTAVLRSSLIFVVVMTAMAAFGVRLIDRNMTREVRLRVLEMEGTLLEIARDEGTADLAERVRLLARGAGGDTLAYALFAPDGTRLAGNTDLRPEPGKWQEASALLETSRQVPADALPRTYLLHATVIGDLTLVTGGNLSPRSSATEAAIQGFALTGFVVVVAMLATGYLLSRKSQSKLERIESVLDRMSQGDTSARTGVAGGTDQIDRISRRIDFHLDRLDTLFHGTRRTAASVAHDLRRPLSRATLSLERAHSRAEAGEDPRVEIEAAQSELARLTSVIATILRIARIEGGGVAPATDVDLRPLLDEIAETYRPVIEDAGQHFAHVQATRPLIVRGDGEMLAQLVVNLIQNAMAHAGAGARISLGATGGPDGVVLTVADDGPGIPEEQRIKVFEPFFRADTARTVEGSGLGLALVKAIAERHGATVKLADARPGLRVTVAFPPPARGGA